jgi:hypothetical protein
MLEIQNVLERDMFIAQSLDHMLRICVHGVFIICGFCAGLQVEELPLLSLDATSKYYHKAQSTCP